MTGKEDRVLQSASWGGLIGNEIAQPARMTKRETIAAMAMQGLLANPSFDFLDETILANDAIDHADALLDGLAKEKTE